jgi:hypothetical protein
MKINSRDSSSILNSLSGGVVPSRGLHHMMVGRTEEAKQILSDLENIKQGASFMKLFIGPFGSGKSFILALIQQIAFKEKFVVTKVDFTPERRLYGRDGQAVSLYTELMKNISIATNPEGGALSTILDKWINEVQMQVARNADDIPNFNDEAFISEVKKEIIAVVSKMDDLTGGFDFARILTLYFEGFVLSNDDLQRRVLRWLRGEYGTRTEAKTDLGVREIISDDNYYEYIKIFSQFVKQIGYSGLVVNLDEAINLYKINHPQSREKNYETILKIYNDTLQGNVEGLYITIGGTPEFLEDERKGLYSYGALKSRLESNQFETDTFRDLSQPVIKLTPLKHEETFVLMQKLRDIHSSHYKYQAITTDEEIKNFMQREYSRPGASINLTVRDIIRKFINALNMLYQNPGYNRSDIFGKDIEILDDESQKSSITSRFSST